MKLSEFQNIVRKIVREEVGRVLPGLMAEAFSERYLRRVVSEAMQSAARPAASVSAKRPAPVAKPRNLKELMQGDAEWEEEVPQAMENDHQGIYHQNPMVRGKGGAPANESRRRGISLADVYGEDPETALQDEREAQRQQMVYEQQQRRQPAIPPGMDPSLFEGTRPTLPEPTSGGSAMGETQQMFGEEGVPLDFLGKLGVNFDHVKRNVEAEAPPAMRERVDEEQAKRLALKWGKPTS